MHVQGELHYLDKFVNTLIDSAPSLSRPKVESIGETDCSDSNGFLILPSLADTDADIHLPADLFTCDDCLRELNDLQKSPLPLSIHQLYTMRSALHADRIVAI